MTDESFIRRQTEISEQSSPPRRRVSPWTVWVYGLPALALLLGVMHAFGAGPFQPLTKTLASESQLEQQIVNLKEETQALEEEVESLMPGNFGIEKHAREQLFWSKPGEIVVHLPDKQ